MKKFLLIALTSLILESWAGISHLMAQTQEPTAESVHQKLVLAVSHIHVKLTQLQRRHDHIVARVEAYARQGRTYPDAHLLPKIKSDLDELTFLLKRLEDLLREMDLPPREHSAVQTNAQRHE